MFGGIETTEGMIANAVLHLLGQPAAAGPGAARSALLAAAVEESLRLEPAAASWTATPPRTSSSAGPRSGAGDPVTVSLSGANRDPAVFPDPDRFDVRRANAGQHLAFAHGPHFCIGAPPGPGRDPRRAAALLHRLPGLRLDPRRPALAPARPGVPQATRAARALGLRALPVRHRVVLAVQDPQAGQLERVGRGGLLVEFDAQAG